MNGVVDQFHKKFPQFKHTKVVVDWIPWGNRVTDWTNALSSGKGGPDITELGNTDTPGIASQGALSNITGDVKSWSAGSTIIPGNLANDTVSGNNFAVPWFGGVRGIWYRTDEFAKAGIKSPPATWAELVADAKLLMKKFPGTYGLGAPSDFTNGIVSFIWGAGGQVAVQQGGQWKAELNSPASEAGIKFYADLFLHRARLPGQVHRPDRTRRAGRDLGRVQRGLRQGHARHVHRRPVGQGRADRGQHQVRVAVGLVPDPERERPDPGARRSPAALTSASGPRARTRRPPGT